MYLTPDCHHHSCSTWRRRKEEIWYWRFFFKVGEERKLGTYDLKQPRPWQQALAGHSAHIETPLAWNGHYRLSPFYENEISSRNNAQQQAADNGDRSLSLVSGIGVNVSTMRPEEKVKTWEPSFFFFLERIREACRSQIGGYVSFFLHVLKNWLPGINRMQDGAIAGQKKLHLSAVTTLVRFANFDWKGITKHHKRGESAQVSVFVHHCPCLRLRQLDWQANQNFSGAFLLGSYMVSATPCLIIVYVRATVF